MASDDAYAAFLEKANADPSAGRAPAAQQHQTAATSSASTAAAAGAPAALVTATQDAFYTSDSDEPFEAVAVPFAATTLPDEDTFLQLAQLTAPSDAVSILDPFDWDPQGRYKALLDAVRAAGRGSDVRVYRVQLPGGTRVEYWLVTIDEQDGGSGRLVGVKAKAVES